jgi:hypothetical protein
VPLPGALRALPVLALLLTMFYWLWRLSVRRSSRAVSVPQSTALAEV